MARSYSRPIEFKCTHCGVQKKELWWGGDRAEEWNQQTLQRTCEACGNEDARWELFNSSVLTRTSSTKAVVYMLPDGGFLNIDPGTPEMVETAASVGYRREFGSVRELDQFCKEQSRRKVEAWKREMDEHYAETGEELYGVMTPTYQQWSELEYSGVQNDVIDFDEQSMKERKGHMYEEMAKRRAEQEAKLARHRPARDGSIRLRNQDGSPGARFRIGRPEDRERYERLKGKR